MPHHFSFQRLITQYTHRALSSDAFSPIDESDLEMYFVALLAWASIAQAAKHRLLVASVEKSAIHVLEFDDSRGSLKSLYEHGTVAPHPSIAIDVSQFIQPPRCITDLVKKTKKFVHGVVPANVGVSVYALGRDYSLQNYSSVSLGNSSCKFGVRSLLVPHPHTRCR